MKARMNGGLQMASDGLFISGEDFGHPLYQFTIPVFL
jgi:hypothetical protein